MTKEQALEIIDNEDLQHFNIGEDRYFYENEVCIYKQNGYWRVFTTDERASIVTGSERLFEEESDAWESFIKRLRADKVLNSYH